VGETGTGDQQAHDPAQRPGRPCLLEHRHIEDVHRGLQGRGGEQCRHRHRVRRLRRPRRILVRVGQQRLGEPRSDIGLPPHTCRPQHVDRDPRDHGRQERPDRRGHARGRLVTQPGLLDGVLRLTHAAQDPVGDRLQHGVAAPQADSACREAEVEGGAVLATGAAVGGNEPERFGTQQVGGVRGGWKRELARHAVAVAARSGSVPGVAHCRHGRVGDRSQRGVGEDRALVVDGEPGRTSQRRHGEPAAPDSQLGRHLVAVVQQQPVRFHSPHPCPAESLHAQPGERAAHVLAGPRTEPSAGIARRHQPHPHVRAALGQLQPSPGR
jgi:hypothetical protein